LRDVKAVVSYLVKDNKNLSRIIHENDMNLIEIDGSDTEEKDLNTEKPQHFRGNQEIASPKTVSPIVDHKNKIFNFDSN
jgi:hypothetical protein